MSYKDIAERIVCPLYTPEGIRCCVESCMKAAPIYEHYGIGKRRKDEDGNDIIIGWDEGENREHSRKMKLSSYRDPRIDSNGKEKAIASATDEDMDDFMCEIIRYVAQSLYNEFSSYNPNTEEFISKVFPDFITKNPELKGMKVKHLLTVANMNNEEILKHKDRGFTYIDTFIAKTYKSMYVNLKINVEHTCANPIYNYKQADSKQFANPQSIGYNKRIYLNGLPDKNQLKFILELFKKCVDRRIPCDMKPCFNSTLDGTVIYANNDTFEDLLCALEETINENPDLMLSFGSPIITGGNVIALDGNCYYAICHGGSSYTDNGVQNVTGMYNTVANRIINNTYELACFMLISHYSLFVQSYHKTFYDEFCNDIRYISRNGFKAEEDVRRILSHDKEGSHDEKRSYSIRKVALDIVKKRPEAKQLLEVYFGKCLPLITSLVNFGDLNHLDVPMYKNESFLQFEESHGHQFEQ